MFINQLVYKGKPLLKSVVQIFFSFNWVIFKLIFPIHPGCEWELAIIYVWARVNCSRPL